jgi:hypothetical protein
LAEVEFEMDSNRGRKLDANLRIFHVSVNSDPEFAWQFAHFPLKISNATMKMNCVPGDSAQLLYW